MLKRATNEKNDLRSFFQFQPLFVVSVAAAVAVAAVAVAAVAVAAAAVAAAAGIAEGLKLDGLKTLIDHCLKSLLFFVVSANSIVLTDL